MSCISYNYLPKEVTYDVLLKRVEKLRELRLLSLQTDPTSFISRYQDEVDQPIEFWVDRHNYPLVEHFVAVETSQPDKTAPDVDVTRFIAFLVLCKDEDEQHQDSAQATNLNVETNQPKVLEMMRRYKLEAIYVEPTCRGRGVCTRLIQEATNWIAKETRKAKMDNAMVQLTVAEGNGSAERLYSKLGFKPTSQTYLKDRGGADRLVTHMEYVLDCSEIRLQ